MRFSFRGDTSWGWGASLRGVAAVDREALPREVARLVAGEEDDGLNDLVHVRGAARRHRGEEIRLRLLVAADEAFEHLGGHRPRRDRVDAHAGRGALERRALGQAFDRML